MCKQDGTRLAVVNTEEEMEALATWVSGFQSAEPNQPEKVGIVEVV